ncbi:MAG: hypothetical protein JRH07_17720 [Deltaproteobacteria bacterium]|nr:hypothetical protein [Deltaproteobacteria bacterium]MBW2123660.1 hypothetical protein [Deltaproteobacteria bacterium]
MMRSDFEIQKEVRRELSRTSADLEKIQFSVTRGVVYLAGEFRVQTPLRNLTRQKRFEVLVGTLIGLEKRLALIREVVDICFNFTNVQKKGGFWRLT